MDPTQLCIELIAGALDGVVVTSQMPAERPDGAYVQVSRTGGPESDFLDEPIMTLVCWDASDYGASSLATECVHILSDAAKDHDLLSSSELITMSRDEWGATGQSRYMAQVQLTINK